MISNIRDVKVEFGHCDPSGIVFNPHYFVWFDASVHALLESADLGFARLVADHGAEGIPLVEAKTRFLAPSRWGDRLRIESCVFGMGRSSFQLEHKLFNGANLAVESMETRVWTVRDPQSGAIRSAPIPEAVARAFER